MIAMKSGWIYLENQDDWFEYRDTLLKSVDPSVRRFRECPEEFPCLVASVILDPKKNPLISFVVAPSDAKFLLSNGEVDRDRGVSDEQSECNKSLTAHVMTLIKLMVDTGIVKYNVDYEKRYLAMLAYVDQAAQNDLLDKLKDLPEETT